MCCAPLPFAKDCKGLLNLLNRPWYRISEFYMARSAPLPRLIIFLTPRKWSLESQPVVLQDSMARIIVVRKFPHFAYPSGSCKSRANQNSIPSSGVIWARLSKWLWSFFMTSLLDMSASWREFFWKNHSGKRQSSPVKSSECVQSPPFSWTILKIHLWK